MKAFFAIVIIIIFTATIVGLWFVGSPAGERARRFDTVRLNHLQMIQSEIIGYWQAKQKLPETLADLNDPLRGFRVPDDPETGKAFEYEKKSDLTFALCAVFAEASDVSNVPGYPKPVPLDWRGPFMGMEAWDHGQGRVCFERTIDKDFYARPGV